MSCHISVLVWCVLMPPRTTKTEWDRRRRRRWRQPSHFHCRLFAALNRNKQLNDESRPDFWLHSIPPRLKLIACLCDATIGTFQFVHCWSRPLKECEVDVNHPFICFTYYIWIFILEKNISEFKSARYQLFRWEQKLFARCPAHKSAVLGSSTQTEFVVFGRIGGMMNVLSLSSGVTKKKLNISKYTHLVVCEKNLNKRDRENNLNYKSIKNGNSKQSS